MRTFRMTPTLHVGSALIKALLRVGMPMGPAILLSVRGRKSGKVYTIPVTLVKNGHERWLVAPFGVVNWVRNLRATGQASLTRGLRTEAIRVEELGTKEAAPILQMFLQRFHFIPFIPPYFETTPTSALADFEREAASHPVFRIVSAHGGPT